MGADEIMDVVNAQDEVLRQAPRSEIYRQVLLHRIVHVLLKNSRNELALQLRSHRVSYKPLHWVTTAGGHVRAGETWMAAAVRELREELGVSVELAPKSVDYYEDTPAEDHPRGVRKLVGLFEGQHDGPFHPDEHDVQRVSFFQIPVIQTMINASEKFHPELLFLLKKYYGVQ